MKLEVKIRYLHVYKVCLKMLHLKKRSTFIQCLVTILQGKIMYLHLYTSINCATDENYVSTCTQGLVKDSTDENYVPTSIQCRFEDMGSIGERRVC